MTKTFKIVFLGDFHFGELYASGAQALADHGYQHAIEHLVPFCHEADQVIVNLETPLFDPAGKPSPFQETKGYLHGADPQKNIEQLEFLGVTAVSLANNHTLDQGIEGLEATFRALDKSGIAYFGAGSNLVEASSPYKFSLPGLFKRESVAIYGSFDYRTPYEEKYQYYATDDRPGANPLMRTNSRALSPEDSSEKTYNIAFPHWGTNYQWVTAKQRRRAEVLSGLDYQLIVGHGAHCIQDFEAVNGTPIFWSIGNSVFLSGGRFDRYVQENEILPYGAWTTLEFEMVKRRRNIRLKLYPIYSDNRLTGFQPRPLSEEHFEEMTKVFSKQLQNFAVAGFPSSLDQDEHGNFMQFELGQWQSA